MQSGRRGRHRPALLKSCSSIPYTHEKNTDCTVESSTQRLQYAPGMLAHLCQLLREYTHETTSNRIYRRFSSVYLELHCWYVGSYWVVSVLLFESVYVRMRLPPFLNPTAPPPLGGTHRLMRWISPTHGASYPLAWPKGPPATFLMNLTRVLEPRRALRAALWSVVVCFEIRHRYQRER